MNIRAMAAVLAATVVLPLGAAQATDLEVTHWWTSGGEAAAVIGAVAHQPTGMVVARNRFGGTRVVDLLVGDPLPRIC